MSSVWNPPPHSVKFSAASELLEQAEDRAWLANEKCRQETPSGEWSIQYTYFARWVGRAVLLREGEDAEAINS
jgi:cysteine synthase